MTDTKQQDVKPDEWVDVVDAQGNPIPENPRAPRAWLGTGLLPEGAKQAPAGKGEDGSRTFKGSQPGLDERAAELEAKAAELAEREKAIDDKVAELVAKQVAEQLTNAASKTPAAPAKPATTK